MTDPTRGLRRLLRVLVLGLSSLLLGVGAHLVGGGSLPGLGVLAVIMIVLGMIATALTRRRLRLPVLTAVLIVEQLGLHAVLSVADHAVPVSGGSHAVHAITIAGPLPIDTMITSPAMWLAHLIATVLTAALLVRGEAALWRLVELLAVSLRVRGRRARTGRNSVPALAAPGLVLRLHLATPRRGPPSCAV